VFVCVAYVWGRGAFVWVYMVAVAFLCGPQVTGRKIRGGRDKPDIPQYGPATPASGLVKRLSVPIGAIQA
jgi:hypothetical protein